MVLSLCIVLIVSWPALLFDCSEMWNNCSAHQPSIIRRLRNFLEIDNYLKLQQLVRVTQWSWTSFQSLAGWFCNLATAIRLTVGPSRQTESRKMAEKNNRKRLKQKEKDNTGFNCRNVLHAYRFAQVNTLNYSNFRVYTTLSKYTLIKAKQNRNR